MLHTTLTKVLLTMTLQPLLVQLSRSLGHASKLIDQFLQDELTPRKMAGMGEFECKLSALLHDVGRHIMAWVLNRLEPESDEVAPSRLRFEGRVYRRQAKQRRAVATLFGTVEVWRRLYEPLERGMRSIHPWELRLGIEADLATPAIITIAVAEDARPAPSLATPGVDTDYRDYYACQYVQQLEDVTFGPGTESQTWAKRMRQQLKTRPMG